MNGNGGGDGRQPSMNYQASSKSVSCRWKTPADQNEILLNAPNDDEWYSFLSRRAPEGVYASINGGPETFLACNPAMMNSGLPSVIGDTSADLDFGLDTILLGQGTLSQNDIDTLHGWGTWRRGVNLNLPNTHPFFSAPPTPVEPRVEAPDGESDPTFDSSTWDWDLSHRGDALDLTGMTLTFDEDFADDTVVTNAATGAGPFYAPGRPDTSIAKFRLPNATNPDVFSVDDPSILTITMSKPTGLTNWFSGHMQTVNTFGEGFTQTYGYFEAKMAFQGPVAWPAFWLYSQNVHKSTSATKCELDIVEAYGTDETHYHLGAHRHPATRKQPGHVQANDSRGDISTMTTGDNFTLWGITSMMDEAFHTYGLMVTEDLIICYFDGFEYARMETFPEAKLPKFMLVTLAMQDDFVSSAVSPTVLQVDYVRAYGFDSAPEAGFGISGFGVTGFGE